MKKILSVILAVSLILSVNAYASGTRFYDVPESHWACGYINAMAEKGIIKGYEDGSFHPENFVTRGEYAKLLTVAGALPLEELYSMVIDLGAMDVSQQDWYAQYLVSVSEYLEPDLKGDGYYYRPNDYATREEVAVSIVKAKGYDVNQADYSFVNMFTDGATIKNENKAYVAIAVEKGIITGYEDNTFRPYNSITRAEAAVILYRAFVAGGDEKPATSSFTKGVWREEKAVTETEVIIHEVQGDTVRFDILFYRLWTYEDIVATINQYGVVVFAAGEGNSRIVGALSVDGGNLILDIEFWEIGIPRRIELDGPHDSSKLEPNSVEVQYDYSKILKGDFSDFVGLWKNGEGYTIDLKADGTEGGGADYYETAEDIIYNNGYYNWGVVLHFPAEDYGESYVIWLYPIGVEIYDEYTGELIPSDTTQVRLYAGHDFCATSESIYYK